MTQYPANSPPPDEEEDDRAVRKLEEDQALYAGYWKSPEWHALATWAAEIVGG
jgi:hypothetical protein